MDKFLEFGRPKPSQSGKTKIWTVRNGRSLVPLGKVWWHGAWRQYAFSPEPTTLFERQCLRAIADFCEQQTKKHRSSKEPSP